MTLVNRTIAVLMMAKILFCFHEIVRALLHAPFRIEMGSRNGVKEGGSFKVLNFNLGIERQSPSNAEVRISAP